MLCVMIHYLVQHSIGRAEEMLVSAAASKHIILLCCVYVTCEGVC